MEVECRRNIIELHLFIESWLKGTVERTRIIYQYFENSFSEDFIIIHPSGEFQTKQEILNDFWSAYGAQSKNFKIEIKNIKIRYKSNEFCIMAYEEWQSGAENTGRISTVIFRKNNNENKRTWFHLHETWLQSK